MVSVLSVCHPHCVSQCCLSPMSMVRMWNKLQLCHVHCCAHRTRGQPYRTPDAPYTDSAGIASEPPLPQIVCAMEVLQGRAMQVLAVATSGTRRRCFSTCQTPAFFRQASVVALSRARAVPRLASSSHLSLIVVICSA